MTVSIENGFTLIELSIVLVIIGLIVGGILVGQSLVSAAGARAQISQIEKYQSAMHTFQTKYGYLPGDVPPGPASSFGFMTRAGTEGRGDGNGLVEGWAYGSTPTPSNLYEYAQLGETVFFWEDLSNAHLIDGTFNTATDAAAPLPNLTLTSTPGIPNWIPAAKIGSGNFVMVWPYATQNGITPSAPTDYFSVGTVANINVQGSTTVNPGFTVAQAYSIDKKIDDGYPVTGQVQARWGTAGSTNFATINLATPPSSTSCFDNNNVYEATQNYSVEVNGGAGVNCNLSFQFQ